jgi:hypothetical protein
MSRSNARQTGHARLIHARLSFPHGCESPTRAPGQCVDAPCGEKPIRKNSTTESRVGIILGVWNKGAHKHPKGVRESGCFQPEETSFTKMYAISLATQYSTTPILQFRAHA